LGKAVGLLDVAVEAGLAVAVELEQPLEEVRMEWRVVAVAVDWAAKMLVLDLVQVGSRLDELAEAVLDWAAKVLVLDLVQVGSRLDQRVWVAVAEVERQLERHIRGLELVQVGSRLD
jgi:hypothetical protein